jgi:hypothetical protein
MIIDIFYIAVTLIFRTKFIKKISCCNELIHVSPSFDPTNLIFDNNRTA